MTRKVAFFLPHFESGGAEGVVLQVLNGIDRRRFAPELILQKQRGALLDRLADDVPVTALEHPRLPRCVPALARCVKDRGLSLVTTVNNMNNLYALAAAAIPGSAFATLIMEHTPPDAFLQEAKWAAPRRRLMQALYPRADLAAGPLEEIGTDLSQILGARAPVFRTLPNPVVDRVAPLRPVPQTATHIASVGRLAPEKRFGLLIDAFAIVRGSHPETRLTIVGEGPERARLEAQIDAAGLQGVVSMPGYATDMDAAHATSDLFVCTSRREGLGNAIIEAMARGVPVVSVDCPFGPRRLLRGGQVGALLSSDTAQAIAAEILSLLADQARRQAYVTAALGAVGDYDAAKAIAGYADAFDTALGLAQA